MADNENATSACDVPAAMRARGSEDNGAGIPARHTKPGSPAVTPPARGLPKFSRTSLR